MIQDITPHQYDNHYIEYQPQITDFCICIKDGTALLCQDKKERTAGTYQHSRSLQSRFMVLFIYLPLTEDIIFKADDREGRYGID